MARPRRDATTVDARIRIQDAFWQLLEEHQLREITVGTITAQAQCNRGTFYYHYRDLDDLIFSVIEEGFAGEQSIARNIFRVCTGGSYRDLILASNVGIYRMGLLLNRGGMDMVLVKVTEVVKNMWQSVLCPHGGELTSEAQAIIEFTAGGMLSILVQNNQAMSGKTPIDPGFLNFMEKNSRRVVDNLAVAQGISKEELNARLAAINEFSRLK